jgi:hypothetical protein
MAAKPKEDVAVASVSTVIEAVKIVIAALEPLAHEERTKVLAAAAILFGIEEQTRYEHD